MRVRRLLALAAGATGLAAVGNRLLRRRAGGLPRPLPGVERTYRWRGMDVSYSVAGDPGDQAIVLVHGIHAAAGSYEFEPIFEQLATEYRVFAVDLPGFGRSDRPPLVYSAGIYREFVREFLRDVPENPIVVASSLSGSFATGAARDIETSEDDDERIDHLVLVCPTGETGPDRPWLRTLLRTPLVGTTLFNLLTSRASLRYFFSREGYYDSATLDDAELTYAWRTAHQAGARYAPASFAAGTLDPNFELAEELAALSIPVTLVWGREATLIPLRAGRELAEAADRELVVIDYATQFPHAEHPHEFVEYLRAELAPIE